MCFFGSARAPRPVHQELCSVFLKTLQLSEPLTSPLVKNFEQKLSIVTAWIVQKQNETRRVKHTLLWTTYVRFDGTPMVFR